jgi:hypothetical protein
LADWTTISSLATAGGTLVLALATFASVRSANRAARTAERSFLVGLRPVLMPSRMQDPPQKLLWVDGHWTRLDGGTAGVELSDGVIYLSIPLRNAGAGIAVLQGWLPTPELLTDDSYPPLETFHPQRADLYVAAGDVGFWQGALRDAADPLYRSMLEPIMGRRAMTIDLLYSDHEGGQRTISRFVITPTASDERWLCTVGRHWTLDVRDPRRNDQRS